MKSLKTPLRYPGGKSRAITKMAQFLPDMSKYKEYREPFLGGGSVALHMTQTYPHLEIWVNDLYEPLVNFWQQLQDESDEITLTCYYCSFVSQLMPNTWDDSSGRRMGGDTNCY